MTLYDLAPGKQIADRYTVVRPNRQGGFARTFEITDERDGSRGEMQLFPAGLFETLAEAREFRDRLTPWTEVESDAVLDVRDVVDADDETIALITDFPEGSSLREHLNQVERMDQADVVTMGAQLLKGLEQIHARSLVHGDIKPYTICLRAGDGLNAMLLDGGVTPGLWTAKALGEKTQLIGTPYYAPFEAFGGDAPDVRSDIYNIATVLYECVTGLVPWAGKSFLEVFQAKLSDPPPMSQRAASVEVTEDLEAAIHRGCLADRNQRYASVDEFREALVAAG